MLLSRWCPLVLLCACNCVSGSDAVCVEIDSKSQLVAQEIGGRLCKRDRKEGRIINCAISGMHFHADGRDCDGTYG